MWGLLALNQNLELLEFSVSFCPGSLSCFGNVTCPSPIPICFRCPSISVWSKNLRNEVRLCLCSTKCVRIFASVLLWFTNTWSATLLSAVVSLLLVLSSKVHMIGGCSSTLQLYLPLSCPVRFLYSKRGVVMMLDLPHTSSHLGMNSIVSLGSNGARSV